jgi:hypothetical protein
MSSFEESDLSTNPERFGSGRAASFTEAEFESARSLLVMMKSGLKALPIALEVLSAQENNLEIYDCY